MKADFHLHSTFSGDGKVPPEEIIRTAIQKGLTAICFTDHLDMDFPYTEFSFELDTEAYASTIHTLQSKYADQIEICFGVELGLQPHLGDYYRSYTSQFPFDFVIGSTHLIDGFDPYYPVFWESHSQETGIQSYLDITLENIKATDTFDIYGHLDYIIRYVPAKEKVFPYSDYADMLDQILKLLIEKGKGLEVNTGGYRAGLKVPNPCPDILKRYLKLGGEIITIGSDAHTAEHVGSSFSLACDILRACGFRYFTVFRERKPVFYPL